MAGYQGLGRITDPDTYRTVKACFDQLQALQARLTALEAVALQAGTTIDATQHRMVNMAAATQGSDAVTLDQLRAYVDAVKKATY